MRQRDLHHSQGVEVAEVLAAADEDKEKMKTKVTIVIEGPSFDDVVKLPCAPRVEYVFELDGPGDWHTSNISDEKKFTLSLKNIRRGTESIEAPKLTTEQEAELKKRLTEETP